jgi:hypothetical protein
VNRLIQDKKVTFNCLFFFLLGGALGWKIGFFENFEYYKLLNLIGLLYDLLAVILLSYAILLKDSIQDLIAHNLSLAVIFFSGMLPVGITTGLLLSMLFGGGNLDGVKYFCVAFALISTIPSTYLFSSPVLEPVGFKSYSPEKRVNILGAVLLFTGFALQLVASAIDFLNGS